MSIIPQFLKITLLFHINFNLESIIILRPGLFLFFFFLQLKCKSMLTIFTEDNLNVIFFLTSFP